MLSGKRISFIKSLHQKKFRREHGLFLAEGDKLVREFLASDFSVKEIYGEPDWLRAHSELIETGTETAGAGLNELERITTLVSPPPVIAIVHIPEYEFYAPEFLEGLTLVLDGIRDPGNMGTIIRTADWFGINRIIASEDCAEIWNPKVVQASMGSVSRVRVLEMQPDEFIKHIQDTVSGMRHPMPRIYGMFMDGNNIYTSALTEPGIIIVGNEANGIREQTANLVNQKLGIPVFAEGPVKPESLNAAIATALVFSEFRRRKFK